jgi:signal peptide peptidase SppA
MPNETTNDVMRLRIPRDELAGVPYLEQYLGDWLLEPAYAPGLLAWCQQLDLSAHLAAQRQAAALQSEYQLADGFTNYGGVPTAVADGIAIVEISGTLMKHKSSMGGGTSTVLVRRQLRALAADDDVRGILLVVESPGGTLAGISDLAADISAAARKKRLEAYIEDLSASAGYWVTAAASRVAINAGGSTGSIGAFVVVTDSSQRAEDMGLTVHVLKTGRFKALGTPGAKIDEAGLAYIQARIDAVGEDFVQHVAASRRMTVEAVRELADGRVFRAAEAKRLGLVDAIESLDETVARMREDTKKPLARNRKMAKDNDEGVLTEIRELAPKAATLAELEDALPGASAEFVLAQIKQQATLAQAQKAYTRVLADEKAKLATQNAEQQAELEKLKAAPLKQGRGVRPLENATGDADDDGEATDGAGDKFRALVDAKVEAGMDRLKAVKAVARQHPQLREAMVTESNAGRG